MKKIIVIAMALGCCIFSNAKTVSVTINPASAVLMQKKNVVPAMSPGVYSITVSIVDLVFTAQADGYDPEQFVINMKSPNTMQINLKPNRKNVTISTDPSEAVILVNGREVGQGQADFTINKGETKSVKAIAEGYDTYVKQIHFNDIATVDMAYNVSLVKNRRDIKVLIDADAAEFWVDGVLIGNGRNEAQFTLKKGKTAQLVVRAPGYLEYSRLFSFFDEIDRESFNLTKDLAIDHAYAASEPGADIANKNMNFMIKKSMTRDQAIQRMKYYISEVFETLEINDNTSGWYRTAWNVEQFDDRTWVRSRVELKEVPDNGDGQIKYKFLLQSQITNKKDARDEDYHPWGRVLKKYAKLVTDIQNIVN